MRNEPIIKPEDKLSVNPKNITYDFIISILLTWVAWVVFSLSNSFSAQALLNGAFMLFFGLLMPFIALKSNLYIVFGIIFLLTIFIFSCRIEKVFYRRVAITFAMATWNIYGAYCGSVFTGGA